MKPKLKILCIGAGPSGLFFAIRMKKKNPEHEIRVVEKNKRGNTFGWGVVLSDETLSNLNLGDDGVVTQIRENLAHWDDIEVHFKNRLIRSSGHGFCGVSRALLLEILTKRAEELGVKVDFECESDPDTFPKYDLVVAADGIFSRTREYFSQLFKTEIDERLCRFCWLGTRKQFKAFTFYFEETPYGWFQAHCYQFSPELSTCVLECHQSTFLNAGLDKMDKQDGIKFCEKIFERHFKGEPLISNSEHLRGSAHWMKFPRVLNQHWFHNNIVLLGDAAATAHFSIGSGTKLGMESAIALSDAIAQHDSIEAALTFYEDSRKIEVLKLQNAARNSTEWFENVALRSKLPPEQFAYSLLTRSQRVSHENLRQRDKAYLEGYERWFAETSSGKKFDKAIPPMFVPFKLRSLELMNRIAVSPMDMYSASDGTPSDFHLVHLGSRALGGAGLIFTEMTCVSAEGRITPGCAGMYRAEHMHAWKKIVDFVHTNSAAKIAIQLGHAGRKGSTQLGWEEMDRPLKTGNWEILSPSAIPYTQSSHTPREMEKADFVNILRDFILATKMSIDAGFDMLELHCAHGYLLSSFISPLTNRRTDKYGGSLENRLRFPLEVFGAIRSAWPKERPISVRISASDWVAGGVDIEEAVKIAKSFKEAGADAIDVSSGQVSTEQRPVYGRMYQTPFADRIRAEVDIATMAVGNIYEPDHVNTIIGAGRADLCLLARPHLSDPHWTLNAAAELGYSDQSWPKQYLSGKQQLESIKRRAKMVGGPV